MRGKAFSLAPLKLKDIKKDNYVKFRHGNATRRILCTDGDDVILRGTRSPGVLEAVNTDTLLSDWQLMVPSKKK
ncbi:MAG: hypothetical protein ACOX69_06940 [Coriobacteriales bacterium]